MVHLSLVPSSCSSSNNQDDPNELADASLAATRMTSSHIDGLVTYGGVTYLCSPLSRYPALFLLSPPGINMVLRFMTRPRISHMKKIDVQHCVLGFL